ncbi:MAG: ribose 5-phosphate isomerase B [Verrucomicrobiota bacterium]
MKIAIGSDHGGVELKERIKGVFDEPGAELTDLGCFSAESCDYPDFAAEVAGRVSRGEFDQGILICKTGLGMSIAANRFPGVRATLCISSEMAQTARSHNDGNVLVLGANLVKDEDLESILETWKKTAFSGEARHQRRIAKLDNLAGKKGFLHEIHAVDEEIANDLEKEGGRQEGTLNLIASENFTSAAVREATGSVATNKYAEGYPGKRWYNGCAHIDEIEACAIQRAKDLFDAEHANVQPHSGSGANMAVYFSVLDPGDTILSLSLAHGGHLTHGHAVNFSGRLFKIIPYGVNEDTEQIDYDELARLAREHKPRMIVAGASAYPRVLDFEKFRKVADETGAYLTVDMAHIAGLVAGGCHPNPVPYADFVTTTTHKTLRGPRGGMILCKEKYAKEVDRQIFPGVQGGPLMNVIAGKAVCLKEAATEDFKAYSKQVVCNAATLAGKLMSRGLRVVSNGTDNHLMLVDVSSTPVQNGKNCANVLEQAGIVVNKNAIPFDKESPFVTSGIRLGTPSLTTRGMREAEMEKVGGIIADVIEKPEDETVISSVINTVEKLVSAYPLP